MAARAGIGLNVAGMQRDPRTMAEVSRMLVGPERTRQEEGGDGHDGLEAGAAEEYNAEEDDTQLADDMDLVKLRELRLEKMKKARQQRAANLAKGHGEYTEIVEEEFLKTVTASEHCVVHFYHKDFQQCKLMDKHLRLLAPRHVETRMVYLNAEKSPFFVEKLRVKTLPTLCVFHDGVMEDKIVGMEGTGVTGKRADAEATGALERRLGITGVIKMDRAFYQKQAAGEKEKPAARQSTIFGFARKNVESDSDDDWD